MNIDHSNRVVAFSDVLGTPAHVCSVDGAAGMGEIFHGLAHGDVVAGQSAGDGDAKGVEAGVGVLILDADSLQEVKPFITPVQFRVRLGATAGAQVFKQGNEFRVQGFCAMAVAFLFKADQAYLRSIWVRVDFDVLHGIEPGFVQANAVPPGDEKAVEEACAHGFGFAHDAVLNLSELFVGQFGVEPAGLLFEAEFVAGVALDESLDDSFAHDDPQHFQFEQRGITSGFVFPFPVIRVLSPFGVTEAMVAGELAGQGDLLIIEKEFNGTPATMVARFIADVFLVSGEEGGHPNIPGLALRVGGDGAFSEGFLCFEFSGAAGGGPDADAVAGGFAHNFVGFWIAEFDPPERRFFLFVKTGHSGMSKYAQGIKNQQKHASKYNQLQAPASRNSYAWHESWRPQTGHGRGAIFRLLLSGPWRLMGRP